MPKVKNPKVPRTRNGKTWTEAEYFNRIANALRKAFAAWVPAKRDAINAVRRNSQSTVHTRIKYEYQCAHCKEWFRREDVVVDHIERAGRLRQLDDIPGWLERLTPEDPSFFQVLCKPDHQTKSNEENRQAREQRKLQRQGNQTGSISLPEDEDFLSDTE